MKLFRSEHFAFLCLSFPARGTWIEMVMFLTASAIFWVVPREGNVD